jgi:O-antigen ligase
VSAFLVAAIAVLQRWWPIGVPYPWSVAGKFRATSVFGYPNAVGLYLGSIVPLCVGGAITILHHFKRGSAEMQNAECRMQNERFQLLTSYFLLLTPAIAIVAIAMAKSTGALVALAVMISISAAWWYAQQQPSSVEATDYTRFHDRGNRCSARRATRRASAIVLVWVVASLVLTLQLPNQPERPRWGSPLVQKLTFQKWSGSVRLAQYRETWALLRDHQIRGAGLAGYQTAIRPYHENERVEIFLYPHNLFLAVWVELGLAGVLIFLAILYAFFRQVLSSFSSSVLQFSIAISMIAMLVHGLVDVPYFKNDLAMLFWVIVALGTIGAVHRGQTDVRVAS